MAQVGHNRTDKVTSGAVTPQVSRFHLGHTETDTHIHPEWGVTAEDEKKCGEREGEDHFSIWEQQPQLQILTQSRGTFQKALDGKR